jgi:tetratricopeptide (TPR) repeat protein
MTEPTTKRTQTTDYERLVRFLISPGPAFGFAIARYADPRVRDRLIDQATRDAHAADLRAESLNLSRTELAGHPNLVDLLEQKLRPKKTESTIRAVFIVQLEKFLIDPFGETRVSPSISVLNQSRDLLPRRIGARVVLWLTDAAANTFATFAHDLYDVALTHFRFEDRDDPIPITQYGKNIPQWLIAATDENTPRLQREASLLETVFRSATNIASKADATFRIAQIRAILNEPIEAERWFKVTLDLYSQATIKIGEVEVRLQYGDFLFQRGDLFSARRYYNDALYWYEHTNNEYMAAFTRLKIIDIFRARGNFNRALGIIENQVLPVFIKFGDIREEAITRATMAEIFEAQGQLNKALEIFQNQVLPVFIKLGDMRSEAITRGQIADILQAQGQLEEALEIRQNQTLPVFIKLGDTRAEAITRKQIAESLQAQERLANILEIQGQLKEALEIRQNQILPVFIKLGNTREEAIMRGKIADILQAQGQLEEALEIRQNQILPVFIKLGDTREEAITRGKIADILQAQGQLEEALEIRQNQILPVFIKLGDTREEAITRGKIADIFQAQGQLEEALEIRQNHELPVFIKLGDTRSEAITQGKIADIFQAHKQLDKALQIRQEMVLPVYKELQDKYSTLIGEAKIAILMFQRNYPEDKPEIASLLQSALQAAREMQIPETEQIENIMREIGLNPESP